MADQKISELTQGTPLETDVIPYVDGVTGTTKKALKSELKGVKGDTGATGSQGIQGIQGIQGATGNTGSAGAAATVDAGTTTTGAPGSSAAVTNTGTTSAAVFAFTIPAGSVIHSTIGIPNNSVGVNGDWAFDTSVNSYVYFKAAGSWSLVNSNRGATGATGSTGATGADITWLGAYSGGTAYVVNDAVSYQGSSYICKLASTGNLPTNGTYFDLLASKGEAGLGSGDMVLADAQIVTGAKTFNSGTLKVNENVAVTATATEINKLAGTPASLSATEIGYLDGVTSSIQTQIDSKKYFHGVLARQVGASNPIPTNITTSVFTLGATANPITYYYQGTKVIVSADKTTTLGAAGFYFIYFDAATGNLLNSTAFPGISNTSNVIIATVMWNGANYGLVGDERHNYTRNTDWHEWAHDTVGVRYESGITLTHNGGTGAAATFSSTSGSIQDEDIAFVVNSSSAFPTAHTVRTLYQDTATTHQFDITPSTAPFRLGTGGRPELIDSATFVKTTVASATNRFVNVFVYVTTDLHTPIYTFVEVASAATIAAGGYTSVALARAVQFPNLSGKGITQELKPIYRLIVRADGALQAIDTTQDDYRLVSSLPMAAGTVNTTAASVSFTPAGNIAATTVQTALEELDTEKVANSLFDANTVLYATTDNTPIALTVGASTIVGRKSTGDIVALTATELRAIANVADGSQANASGGTLTTALNLGENAGLQLDTALSADGKWSGITETGTAGATLAFGDLCYFQASDSRWELVDANLSAGYDKKLGMCVLAAAGDGSATEMLLIGKIRADAKFPTMTIGSALYMSETAGGIVVAQPVTADVAIRVVGYGNTADELWFSPSQDYIVHT